MLVSVLTCEPGKGGDHHPPTHKLLKSILIRKFIDRNLMWDLCDPFIFLSIKAHYQVTLLPRNTFYYKSHVSIRKAKPLFCHLFKSYKHRRKNVSDPFLENILPELSLRAL